MNPKSNALIGLLSAAVLALILHAATAAAQDAAVQPGAVFEALNDAGVSTRLRVDAIERDPQDRDGDTRLYTLSRFDAPSSSWQTYCLPDTEGKSRSIPVAGSWNEDGSLAPATDAVTFACTSGAIGKCIRFGYKPWKTVGGVSLRDYHQACIRMVRADYCGDGRAHTREGTRIEVWDALGIQRREQGDARPAVFEAAWGPQGAQYVNVPRWSDDVRELVRECPERLRGRTSATLRRTAEEVSGAFPGALLFNARFIREADRIRPVGEEH